MDRHETTAITRARSMLAALADHPAYATEPLTASDYERTLIGLDTICRPPPTSLLTTSDGDPHALYDQARTAITALGDVGVLDDLQVELILDELHAAFHGRG